eukprot:GEMP01111645.1.p1 GENE.GEMP01111645.1~~GEMP01111645.1.p1  ORF type:complete len:114 (-),score=10.88 GEMP01111645.1:50-391(-)
MMATHEPSFGSSIFPPAYAGRLIKYFIAALVSRSLSAQHDTNTRNTTETLVRTRTSAHTHARSDLSKFQAVEKERRRGVRLLYPCPFVLPNVGIPTKLISFMSVSKHATMQQP